MPFTPSDSLMLDRALELAHHSRQCGHHPFAALVVNAQGDILAEAMNASSSDRTAHAEMNALRTVSACYTPEQLQHATLYSSAEPCAMCAGALYWSGVGRLVYALSETALRGATGNDPENPTLAMPCRTVLGTGQRHIEIIGPLREQEALQAHAGFWHPATH